MPLIPRPNVARAQGGFFLLEVLIAFAIAGLALAVLYQGGASSLAISRDSGHTARAVSHARSRMTALCHGARLAVGEQSGDDGGGFRWQTKITRGETATIPRGDADEPKPPIRADLFNVRVAVTWRGAIGGERRVALARRCLALVAEGSP